MLDTFARHDKTDRSEKTKTDRSEISSETVGTETSKIEQEDGSRRISAATMPLVDGHDIDQHMYSPVQNSQTSVSGLLTPEAREYIAQCKRKAIDNAASVTALDNNTTTPPAAQRSPGGVQLPTPLHGDTT